MSDFMDMMKGLKPIDESVSITLNEKDYLSITGAFAAVRAEMPTTTKITRNLPNKDLKMQAIDKYSIGYNLSKQDKEKFESEVQGYYVTYEPRAQHDHPLSHMYTELAERDVLKALKGVRYVDLFGNQTRNKQWKTNAVTVAGLFTGKDYLRARHMSKDILRYQDMDSLTRQIRGIKEVVAIHTLYYIGIEEIATLLFAEEDRCLTAIVHRHGSMRGMINGECSYEVDNNGMVNQKTPLGESYTHPTLEPFFKQFEAKTTKGYVAWTISKTYGDSYKLTFVACPGFKPRYIIQPLVLPSVDEKVEISIVKTTKHFQTMNFFGYKWLKSREDKKIELKDTTFLDDLRLYIACKDRNATTLKDLIHYARRLTDKKDLFAKHADSYHCIEPNLLPWYIFAAFYEDLDNEIDAMLTMRRTAHNSVALHSELRDNLSARETSWKQTIQEGVEALVEVGASAAHGFVKTMDVTGYDVPYKMMVENAENMAKLREAVTKTDSGGDKSKVKGKNKAKSTVAVTDMDNIRALMALPLT